MWVWCDGSLLPDPTAPALRVDDHGLTVGDGVFETLKISDGVPFALNRHLVRLTEGSRRLGLPDPDLDAVRRGIAAVLGAADEASRSLGRLRVTYTAGPGPFGSQRGDHDPTLVVALAVGTPQPESAVVVRVPWVRNERSAVAGVKTISFAENVVALAGARELGASEALLANTLGNLCEGTGSNVGYVVDGQARTPSLASGCLPGVTRALLVEWAGVVEVDEPWEVLDEASEIFLLSSTREVQPVRRLDDRELPAPGPVTAGLQRVWASKAVELGRDP